MPHAIVPPVLASAQYTHQTYYEAERLLNDIIAQDEDGRFSKPEKHVFMEVLNFLLREARTEAENTILFLQSQMIANVLGFIALPKPWIYVRYLAYPKEDEFWSRDDRSFFFDETSIDSLFEPESKFFYFNMESNIGSEWIGEIFPDLFRLEEEYDQNRDEQDVVHMGV